MKGFDTKSLVLFPTQEFYEEKGLQYRYQFQMAVRNLFSYLKAIGMEAHAFITDDLARTMPDIDVKYIATLTRGDLFFISNNCGVPKEVMQWDMVNFSDICTKIQDKDQLPPDLSIEDRFQHILTRDKKAITSIIPMYNVVIHFYKRGATRYRVAIKPNGGKIRLIIDLDTFVMTAYINNVEENPIDLLGIKCGNKSLTNWEVDNENL